MILCSLKYFTIYFSSHIAPTFHSPHPWAYSLPTTPAILHILQLTDEDDAEESTKDNQKPLPPVEYTVIIASIIISTLIAGRALIAEGVSWTGEALGWAFSAGIAIQIEATTAGLTYIDIRVTIIAASHIARSTHVSSCSIWTFSKNKASFEAKCYENTPSFHPYHRLYKFKSFNEFWYLHS